MAPNVRRSLRAVAVALLLLPAGPAHAIRVATPRPARCALADLVIVGEVTDATGRWRQGEPGGVETVVDVALIRTVRGSPPADTVTVVTPGGTVGALTQTITDTASLRVDARYLLLLRRSPDGYTIVGGPDGAIPLRWSAAGAGEDEAAAIASLGDCRG
jgi:hypothetical protein